MSKGLIDLISILDLEPLEVNLFRGNSPKTSWQRVFGGQVIGQAMVAACRTVEGRLPHSLHCYFILPGDPQIPIIYEVERLRDGKSYSTRRISAIQHGHAIFSMMVSFHVEDRLRLRRHLIPHPERLEQPAAGGDDGGRARIAAWPQPQRRIGDDDGNIGPQALTQAQCQRQPGKRAAADDNATLCRHAEPLTHRGHRPDLLPDYSWAKQGRETRLTSPIVIPGHAPFA